MQEHPWPVVQFMRIQSTFFFAAICGVGFSHTVLLIHTERLCRRITSIRNTWCATDLQFKGQHPTRHAREHMTILPILLQHGCKTQPWILASINTQNNRNQKHIFSEPSCLMLGIHNKFLVCTSIFNIAPKSKDEFIIRRSASELANPTVDQIQHIPGPGRSCQTTTL